MTWVIFDFGGVLSAPQPQRDLAALAAVFGCGVPALREAYWARRNDYDIAALTAEAYWQDVAQRLGRRLDPVRTAELVRLDSASWLHLRPGTARLVADLAARRHPLALLSNAPIEISAAVAALPLARSFEQLLFSCHLGTAKPDPRCFRAALDRLGAHPAEVVLVDDRPANVAMATRLGMAAIRFTAPARARAKLAALGFL